MWSEDYRCEYVAKGRVMLTGYRGSDAEECA